MGMSSLVIGFCQVHRIMWKILVCLILIFYSRFSDPDCSKNQKNERFKVFLGQTEIRLRSNCNDIIIDLTIK